MTTRRNTVCKKCVMPTNACVCDKPTEDSCSSLWEVQVKGEKCSQSWEISVVRKDNEHGHKSWGWFDDTKLLVSHNGGPCSWPIVKFVWNEQIRIAYELCDKLNSGEISL